MTIISFTKPATWQKIGVVTDDNPTGYIEVREDVVQHPDVDHVLDGMVAIQAARGTQINWSDLQPNIAKGTSYSPAHGGYDRHVVIDTDLADGLDIVNAVNWLYDA